MLAMITSIRRKGNMDLPRKWILIACCTLIVSLVYAMSAQYIGTTSSIPYIRGNDGGDDKIPHTRGNDGGDDKIPHTRGNDGGDDKIPHTRGNDGGDDKIPHTRGNDGGDEKIPHTRGNDGGDEKSSSRANMQIIQQETIPKMALTQVNPSDGWKGKSDTPSNGVQAKPSLDKGEDKKADRPSLEDEPSYLQIKAVIPDAASHSVVRQPETNESKTLTSPNVTRGVDAIESGPCVYYNNKSRDRGSVKVLGVAVDDFAGDLIEPKEPLWYLKEYKSPCWLETLPKNFLDDYEHAPWYSYGKKNIMGMKPIFDKRLNSSAPWRLRCLPYVYLAGVTKSGTTDMYDTISRHPDVYEPWVKEYMFWNKHRYPKGALSHEGLRNGPIKLSKFVKQFDYPAHRINQSYVNTSCGRRHNGITIDGSSYLFWEDNGWDQDPANAGLKEPVYTNADALHDVQPDARIIVLMRNPADRVHSAFDMYTHEPHLHFDKNKTTPQHFDKYVTEGIRAYNACFAEHGIRACTYNASLSCKLHPISLRPSFYSVYLRDWWKAFGKQQVLVIKSEDYYANRIKTFDEVRQFLGLAQISEELQRRIRSKGIGLKRRYAKMLPSTRTILDTFFEPFNKELEELLGKPMWDLAGITKEANAQIAEAAQIAKPVKTIANSTMKRMPKKKHNINQ